MDETLIYIIILVVIYLVRFFLKSKEQEPTSHMPDDRETPMEKPTGPRKPTTFEELLEEMGRGYRKEEPEVTEYEEEYETLEDPYYQHPVDYQSQAERDKEAVSVYEKSVSQAQRFKTIDEQVDIKHFDVKIETPADIKWEEKVVASKYARMMRNPQSLKDAIVINELLNRKY
jgi:hypothetical protein